ncbi:oligosaccharide flippase family protein [Microbacterium sp. NPDC090007]|uniref:oligosaccharide flippase family protein n=1 Tax=Microbacterium sp. NPDC090007 TaxID=3364204 RepID=UPI003806E40A
MTEERRVQAAPVGGRRLVAGGSLLAGAMLLANVGNYALNLYLGRVLTPAEFSDANLMVTLLFTLTSVALCLQMVAARFVAHVDAAGYPGDADGLVRRLYRLALWAGIGLAVVLAAGAPLWSELFRTASPWPFVVLGAGVPFWLVQAVGRGALQARLAFPALATSFVVEMVTRVGLGVALVSAGFGVIGATVALSVSFVVTCAVVSAVARPRGHAAAGTIDPREVRAYAGMVSILLVGQILANNSDILISKAVFPPAEAGVYAAVALVGRAVFFLAWSVATVVFPVAVRRHATGDDASPILRNGAVIVTAIGLACAGGAFLWGGPVLAVVLGPAYAGLSVPLAGYALTTTLFAIGNLVASYHLSRSDTRPSRILLVAAAVQVVFLVVWHSDIASLILAQGAAMVLLLLALAANAIASPATARERASRKEHHE